MPLLSQTIYMLFYKVKRAYEQKKTLQGHNYNFRPLSSVGGPKVEYNKFVQFFLK